jgi:hypothetical protein
VVHRQSGSVGIVCLGPLWIPKNGLQIKDQVDNLVIEIWRLLERISWGTRGTRGVHLGGELAHDIKGYDRMNIGPGKKGKAFRCSVPQPCSI